MVGNSTEFIVKFLKRYYSPSSRFHFELISLVMFILGLLTYLFHGGFPSCFLSIIGLVFLTALMVPFFKRYPLRQPGVWEEAPGNENGSACFVHVWLAAEFVLFMFILLLRPLQLTHLLRKVEFPFLVPTMVVADSEGSVYVLNDLICRVQKYDTQGKFEFGWFTDLVKTPGLAIDAADNIYLLTCVCDIYSPSGELVKTRTRMGHEVYGWWFLDDAGEVATTPEIREPDPPTYAHPLRPGDILPGSTGLGIDTVGFEAQDGTRFTIRYVFGILPMVEVTQNSEHIRWIRPNVFSLLFGLPVPGFIVVFLLLGIGWIKNKGRKTRWG
jgi:hypothetical protein